MINSGAPVRPRPPHHPMPTPPLLPPLTPLPSPLSPSPPGIVTRVFRAGPLPGAQTERRATQRNRPRTVPAAGTRDRARRRSATPHRRPPRPARRRATRKAHPRSPRTHRRPPGSHGHGNQERPPAREHRRPGTTHPLHHSASGRQRRTLRRHRHRRRGLRLLRATQRRPARTWEVHNRYRQSGRPWTTATPSSNTRSTEPLSILRTKRAT